MPSPEPERCLHFALTKQPLESVGGRILNSSAIVSPCAVMRDLAVPWNCCGSAVSKQMSAGIVQQALPVLCETHGKK